MGSIRNVVIFLGLAGCVGCIGIVPPYAHGGGQYVFEWEPREAAQPIPSLAAITERVDDHFYLFAMWLPEKSTVSAHLQKATDGKFTVRAPLMLNSGALTLGSHLELTPVTSEEIRLMLFAPGYRTRSIRLHEVDRRKNPSTQPTQFNSRDAGRPNSTPDLSVGTPDEPGYYKVDDDGRPHCRFSLESLPNVEDAEKKRGNWYPSFTDQLHRLARLIREGHLITSDTESRRIVYNAIQQQSENAACQTRPDGVEHQSRTRAKEAKRVRRDLAVVAGWAHAS